MNSRFLKMRLGKGIKNFEIKLKNNIIKLTIER
jgi:hypothetical protein